MPRYKKQKSKDHLKTYSWTSQSACTRGPEKEQREQVPESVQTSVSMLERRNTQYEAILKGIFPLIDSMCLRKVISSSQVIPYHQTQVVQTCMSNVQQKVQEMVIMTLQSAAT